MANQGWQLQPGCIAALVGLEARSVMNGEHVLILCYVPERMRWHCRAVMTGDYMNVRAENLRLVTALVPPGPEATPAMPPAGATVGTEFLTAGSPIVSSPSGSDPPDVPNPCPAAPRSACMKRRPEDHEDDSNRRSPPASSCSSTNAAFPRPVRGDADITGRWSKSPRTGKYGYTEYMLFEKQRLVDLLMAKDEELAFNAKELSKMKGLSELLLAAAVLLLLCLLLPHVL